MQRLPAAVGTGAPVAGSSSSLRLGGGGGSGGGTPVSTSSSGGSGGGSGISTPVSTTGSGGITLPRSVLAPVVSGSLSSLVPVVTTSGGSGTIFNGLISLLGVTVEEEVHHHLPGGLPGEGAAEAENLTGKEPVHGTDGVLALVVAGDGDIHVLEGRIGIAESDGGHVHVGRLDDRLGVSARVREDQKARLLEALVDLVSESTRGETASDGSGTSVLGELQHGTLAVRTGGEHAHISRVLDGNDDASSKHKLLPGVVEVDDVDAISAALPHISLHLEVDVLGAKMSLGRHHHVHISFFVSHRTHVDCRGRESQQGTDSRRE
eukprot:Rmarinus@m.9027